MWLSCKCHKSLRSSQCFTRNLEAAWSAKKRALHWPSISAQLERFWGVDMGGPCTIYQTRFDAPKSGCLEIVSIAPVKSGAPFACWLARFLHIYLYISHTNGTSSVSPHHDISPLMAVSSCALFRRHRQWWRAQRAQGPLSGASGECCPVAVLVAAKASFSMIIKASHPGVAQP